MNTKAKDRKILEIGGSYLITLPREFILKNKLKKGDSVGLTYNEVLLICVPRLPERKEKEDDH